MSEQWMVNRGQRTEDSGQKMLHRYARNRKCDGFERGQNYKSREFSPGLYEYFSFM
jgi:hypothetical protein